MTLPTAMEQPGLASPGVLTSDPEEFIPAIQSAQEDADLVVVHLHAGQEYDSSPTTRQQELAKAISDAGADIIVGHHPHVLQSVDVYNDTLIMYSMGNFIFDQGWTRTRDSAVAEYELMEDGTARIEFKPYRIFEAQPRPVEGLTEFVHRFRIFRQLTKDTTNEEAIVENDERLYLKSIILMCWKIESSKKEDASWRLLFLLFFNCFFYPWLVGRIIISFTST
ncbi:CapA family protein [Sinobaca sp. H24]|uniref:CapA family protein n=1 Tax=Sinobaca sp. H24 TaxID=2923376 RepID=UPI00207B042A|nr:CapA family protein [Sinobaca sp. H24]